MSNCPNCGGNQIDERNGRHYCHFCGRELIKRGSSWTLADGGVRITGGNVNVGGDIVGRDKIVRGGDR